ncbi:LacI family DNA-binding transcriptional regulator [Bifidobacterium sp. H1HS10N]|uniref:LacI family DNA-binding transcriptional regulator n=1 Tax=Bifidobacterium kimbladii TaxID=1293826 RepID=UPI0028BED034|nr:LacI family DNA-binding transcriptional regulator [Bifidobacterium sp. H1HS10N]MDT7512598.1 LacI family DNA-binding transcriptional regulator [Bifidobacterium sp. H1HS10N]
MSATIQEVARAAGVSVSTVGRAFSNPKRVSNSTREHVLQVASAMGYRVLRSASALKSGQSMRVALLVNETASGWFNASVFSGMNTVLQKSGYDISVFERIDDAATRESFFSTLPVRRNADAVVVASFGIDIKEADKLKTLKVPIVGINVPSTQGFDASISIDDSEGEAMAVKHLIHLGHRNLAYLCSEKTPDLTLDYSTDRRQIGFIKACEQVSQNPENSNKGHKILQSTITLPRNPVQAIDAAIAKLFALRTFPTAICCQSDGLAIPLLIRLQQYGKRIPQDCSIIGFDDALGSEAAGLTTIRQNPVDLGSRAAEMILSLIAGKPLKASHQQSPVSLIPRRTDSLPNRSQVD